MEDKEYGAVSLFLILDLRLRLRLHLHSLYFSRTFPTRLFHRTIALNSGS